MADAYDVRDFRFRADNVHNRDMLEYQAEKAFTDGAMDLAAQFAQAAALYAVAGLLADAASDRDQMLGGAYP